MPKEFLHVLPEDFKKVIVANKKAQAVWDSITPLARSEWVCWVISGKREDTRGIRLEKAISKLSGGMRRPCCWIGCQHR